MQDRFKFRAIVKGYYYIDTPEKCEEFEPIIFLEDVDVLSNGQIGIQEKDLECAIREQHPSIEDNNVEFMLESFRDNSNGVDSYVTITPKVIYQSTGLKDKNVKLIYEKDIVKDILTQTVYKVSHKKCVFYLENKECVGYFHELSQCFSTRRLEVIGNIYENPELLCEVE